MYRVKGRGKSNIDNNNNKNGKHHTFLEAERSWWCCSTFFKEAIWHRLVKLSPWIGFFGPESFETKVIFWTMCYLLLVFCIYWQQQFVRQLLWLIFVWQVAGCSAQWEAFIFGFRISGLGFEEAHGFMPRLWERSPNDKSEWDFSSVWRFICINLTSRYGV